METVNSVIADSCDHVTKVEKCINHCNQNEEHVQNCLKSYYIHTVENSDEVADGRRLSDDFAIGAVRVKQLNSEIAACEQNAKQTSQQLLECTVPMNDCQCSSLADNDLVELNLDSKKTLQEADQICLKVQNMSEIQANCDIALSYGNTTFLVTYSSEEEVSSNSKQSKSLQDAFSHYRKLRQRQLKKARRRKDIPDELRLRALADPDTMLKKRMLFLEQVKKYFGTPYAKKYWNRSEPEFYSPLYLDCCGLVRRVLRDLRRVFGFRIGPWNQAYMFDTLPIRIDNLADVKPGDLVFISAIYYNEKAKKQRHNMVHVEVMCGEGEKSIGSRWHRGHVQVFDSYQFVSTSYHSMQYHFRSIDTWLQGVCRSHCDEHPWKTRNELFNPSKKSIFSLQQQQQSHVMMQNDEGASDSEDEALSGTARSHNKDTTLTCNISSQCEKPSSSITRDLSQADVVITRDLSQADVVKLQISDNVSHKMNELTLVSDANSLITETLNLPSCSHVNSNNTSLT